MANIFILTVFAILAIVQAQEFGRRDNFDERGPYVGGDMVFLEEQKSSAKAGIVGANYRWPQGQIPYVLGRNFTRNERRTITAAFKEIQDKTCIRFIKRRNQTDYIDIVRGASNTGCWSYVGKIGGKQQVNLQFNGCIYKGIVAHELTHAIGYFHEQSRTDRDDWVQINTENIQDGAEHNFDKYNSDQVDPFGVDYDYESLMHYSAYAFSKNDEPTIEPLKTTKDKLGQRDGYSAKDAQKVNNMYKGVCN